jgi:hypothetical protein
MTAILAAEVEGPRIVDRGQFAEEVGANYSTMRVCYATYRAWLTDDAHREIVKRLTIPFATALVLNAVLSRRSAR